MKLFIKKAKLYSKMLILVSVFVFLFANCINASSCGCKRLRKCYSEMLNKLQDRDEATCIEDAAIGSSTMVIFLKALTEFCGEVIKVNKDSRSYEGRYLYEVVISRSHEGDNEDDNKPVIVIEAGQQAGTEPVVLALFIIEQLVACEEYHELIEKVRWVILPCTNPDGQEFVRYNRLLWKKNLKPSSDNLSYGVDISRNFDFEWNSCDKIESTFSSIYPGPAAASENETVFIKNVISKYKTTKAYLSIRRDGHAFLYPHAYSKNKPGNIENLLKIASAITTKVNHRAGGVQMFVSSSIYEANGKPYCGHSVDYVFSTGVHYSFEMRVFLGSDYRIMSKFQTLPRGYETSLRNAYFIGIRELYNIITNEKKYAINKVKL